MTIEMIKKRKQIKEANKKRPVKCLIAKMEIGCLEYPGANKSHDRCSELLGMRMPKVRWAQALTWKVVLVVDSFKLHLNAFIVIPVAQIVQMTQATDV